MPFHVILPLVEAMWVDKSHAYVVKFHGQEKKRQCEPWRCRQRKYFSSRPILRMKQENKPSNQTPVISENLQPVKESSEVQPEILGSLIPEVIVNDSTDRPEPKPENFDGSMPENMTKDSTDRTEPKSENFDRSIPQNMAKDSTEQPEVKPESFETSIPENNANSSTDQLQVTLEHFGTSLFENIANKPTDSVDVKSENFGTLIPENTLNVSPDQPEVKPENVATSIPKNIADNLCGTCVCCDSIRAQPDEQTPSSEVKPDLAQFQFTNFEDTRADSASTEPKLNPGDLTAAAMTVLGELPKSDLKVDNGVMAQVESQLEEVREEINAGIKLIKSPTENQPDVELRVWYSCK